jgi:RimJ/RimL family protein N-acetyltransferase
VVGEGDEAGAVLTTERLLLRSWRDDDAEPFSAMNADPEVMRHLGGPMSRAASDALLAKFRDQIAAQPYGRWAVEHRGSQELLGFVGLGHHPVAPEAPEIGWRLAAAWWGGGLATEAALAVRDHAFGPLGLPTIVSVTVPENLASLAVMRRLGMTPFAERTLEMPGAPDLSVVVYSVSGG